MFRYQILIEYVGTDFRGWQVQKKGKTIQGLIQQKISKILKEKVILFGSGRTDTGVHAIEQSAHFDSSNKIKDINKFLKSLNHFLNVEKGEYKFDNAVIYSDMFNSLEKIGDHAINVSEAILGEV